MLVAIIVIALVALYIVATRNSRKPDRPDWVVPGNGYGRHGYHSQKQR